MSDSTGTSSPQKQQIRQLPIFWMRKIMTFLDVQDMDKDGIIGYEDLMTIGDRFARLAKNEKTKNDLIEIHRKRHKILNESDDNKGAMTLTKQILKYWQLKDNPAVVEQWRRASSGFFKILDQNSKGFLSFDDFVLLWKILGLDLRYVRLQFEYIDTNQDGLIHEEEFVNARMEYLTNTNDDGNRFYGPLISY